ncbi:hypothetical protein AWC29_27360 [Mycobacterium triplex]|uniref:Uncharacterized protein n=1 Tax=Mycobacterium triplex TaxID=47839 RepID=A0ABX3VX58_9MYCO|nr:hypothetical protein AWC29_27360 [Mycobacterium triplex]
MPAGATPGTPVLLDRFASDLPTGPDDPRCLQNPGYAACMGGPYWVGPPTAPTPPALPGPPTGPLDPQCMSNPADAACVGSPFLPPTPPVAPPPPPIEPIAPPPMAPMEPIAPPPLAPTIDTGPAIGGVPGHI